MDSVFVFGKPFSLVSSHDQHIGPALRTRGFWEPINTRIVTNHLMFHPDTVFVDIGANAGYYSVLASEILSNRGQVLAYEPDPLQFQCLVDNIRRRDLKNVQAFALAAGNENRMAKLMQHHANFGDNRIYPGQGTNHDDEWNFKEGLIDVEMVTLDSHLKGVVPDLIKIDVQGYEYFVLEGLKDTLHQLPNHFVMICEWTPKMLRTQGVNPVQLVEFLRSYDLHLYINFPNYGIPTPLEDWKPPSDWQEALNADLICSKNPLEPRALSEAFLPTLTDSRLLTLIADQLNGHDAAIKNTVSQLEALGYSVSRPSR